MGLRLTDSERAEAGGEPGDASGSVAPRDQSQTVPPPGAAASGGVQAGRVLVLVALLAVADMWLHHHFGFGFRNIGIPVGFAAALGLGIKAAGFLVGDDRVKASLRGLTDPVKAVLPRLVTTRALVGASAVLVTAMLLVSSVTVVSDDGSGRMAVQVTPLERIRAGEPRVVNGAATTIPVWTTPFGRLFRVAADGYVGSTFTVYPPVGLRLRLGRELPALPAVLFRPAPETLGFLADGAVLTVTRIAQQRVDTIAVDTGYVGSFMLGRAGTIGAALVDDWERELMVGDSTVSRAGVNATILLWKKPRQLAHDPARLRIGDRLRAEVRLGEVLVGRGEVTLEGDALIEVVLEEVRDGWNE